jgi:hypothetical protein
MHELAARLDQADRIIGKMQRAISIILTDVTRWVRIASAGLLHRSGRDKFSEFLGREPDEPAFAHLPH